MHFNLTKCQLTMMVFFYLSNNILKCLCDVTLSVYPHRERLKNMPGHGGIWAGFPKVIGSNPTVARHIFQAFPVWIYTQSNITQASYSPEYITPTQQYIKST
jgi:hypothetical protein